MTTDRYDGTGIAHDSGFVEVADRCWVARHRLADVNVSVVGGKRGLVVVDTHSSAATARGVLEAVRGLGAGDVVAVVNTHAHWDHVLGTGTFREAYGAAPVVAHDATAATLRERGRTIVQDASGEVDQTGTEVVVPDDTFSSVKVVDLGDRLVELLHPGRGHTAGDLVARVADADVLLAGDLVEQNEATGHTPGFGEDCFPLEWPSTLDLVISLLGEASIVVPGHGNPVDKSFVLEQRGAVGLLAETVRDLAGRGVRPADMAGAGEWPYPVEVLDHAFRRGFEQLPRGARSLPLA